MRLILLFWGVVVLAVYFAAAIALIDAGSVDNLAWRLDGLAEEAAR